MRSTTAKVRVALIVLGFIGLAKGSELSLKSILGGRAEISVPAALAPMTDEYKLFKYPGANPPQDAFSDKEGTVSVAASMRSLPGIPPIDEMVSGMATGFDRVRKIVWIDKGKRTINGREFGFLEFKATTIDSEVYNYLYFTFDGSDMIVFTANSAIETLETWKGTLEEIIASTRILPVK